MIKQGSALLFSCTNPLCFLHFSLILTASNLKEFCNISLSQDKDHDQRKDVAYVKTCPSWELNARSLICFCQELFKAPSITAGAEQQIQKTSNRQQVITEDKVLKILDIRTCSQWLEAAPDIKSKYTWKRQDDHYYYIPCYCFLLQNSR